MKTLILIIALVIALCAGVLAETPPMNGYVALEQVPIGESYDTRPTPPRPPLWTSNRWHGIDGPISNTDFQNSPANGTNRVFYLARNVSGVFYPILYVSEENLHIYKFGVGQVEIMPGDYTLEQGTGKITLDAAPENLSEVFFEITGNTSKQTATFSLSGRVATSKGQGVSSVIVISSEDCKGWPGIAINTSPFGYYAADIPNDCQSFFVTPSSKNNSFSPGSIFFGIVDGQPLSGVNFTAN